MKMERERERAIIVPILIEQFPPVECMKLGETGGLSHATLSDALNLRPHQTIYIIRSLATKLLDSVNLCTKYVLPLDFGVSKSDLKPNMFIHKESLQTSLPIM